jgi:RNA polymerase sigma factor (sigma-70 family)
MTRGDVAQIARSPDAFEIFYREHIDRVQRFVARRVRDPQLAADLTAEIFLAVIESADSFRPSRGTVVGWLYGISYHVIAADRRRSAREAQAVARLVGRRLLDSDDLGRIEARIDAETEGRRLHEALGHLSSAERVVLELTALDGLAVADAARVLGIRAATARVRLHRARERMREHL